MDIVDLVVDYIMDNMVMDNMVVDNIVLGIVDFDIVMVLDKETGVLGYILVFVAVEIVAENHHYH